MYWQLYQKNQKSTAIVFLCRPNILTTNVIHACLYVIVTCVWKIYFNGKTCTSSQSPVDEQICIHVGNLKKRTKKESI